MKSPKKISKKKILLIGKKDDFYCMKAIDFMKQHFHENELTIVTGTRHEILPDEIRSWKGDYIFSYLSPWIIPASLLERAKYGGINFHPGPPEYPGIGCTNFAIYNNEKSFGITCHYMDPKVDTGKIISVKRFPLLYSDSVFSLTQRCYAFILVTFYEIVSAIAEKKSLPKRKEKWKRKPFKRSELNELCIITRGMSKKEINRRIKAVEYPGYEGPYMLIGGKKKFILQS